MITDAKKLLDCCQQTEESIFYDIISFCVPPDGIITIQYQVEHLPEIVTECREMLHNLLAHDSGTKTFKLRNDLRQMIIRLEAVIMYAKNH
jgi:hypothetical protein